MGVGGRGRRRGHGARGQRGALGGARDALARHLLALATLARLASALDAASCPWIVFKGPAVAKLGYPRPGLRSYHDVDALVAPERFSDALDALGAAGFLLADRNWGLVEETGAGQLHLELPGAAPVDLHWHVLFTKELRERFAVPTGELLERSRPVDLGGVAARTLDPCDTLLHLCLHAALEGGDRLCWLKDVDLVARHDPPDWDELVKARPAQRGARGDGGCARPQPHGPGRAGPRRRAAGARSPSGVASAHRRRRPAVAAGLLIGTGQPGDAARPLGSGGRADIVRRGGGRRGGSGPPHGPHRSSGARRQPLRSR